MNINWLFVIAAYRDHVSRKICQVFRSVTKSCPQFTSDHQNLSISDLIACSFTQAFYSWWSCEYILNDQWMHFVHNKSHDSLSLLNQIFDSILMMRWIQFWWWIFNTLCFQAPKNICHRITIIWNQASKILWCIRRTFRDHDQYYDYFDDYLECNHRSSVIKMRHHDHSRSSLTVMPENRIVIQCFWVSKHLKSSHHDVTEYVSWSILFCHDNVQFKGDKRTIHGKFLSICYFFRGFSTWYILINR